MTAPRDKFGRPIVVVTGMGVITSLGAGKTDNWTKLPRANPAFGPSPAFRSRSEDHDGRNRSTSSRSSRFRRPVSPSASAELAAEEAIAQAGIGSQGRFSGPAVPRGRAGRGRMAAADGAWHARSASRHQLRRPAARLRRRQVHALSPPLSCSARSPTIWPRRSAPRARRSRCRRPAPPARPRSSSASKRSGAARPMPRCASQPTVRSIRRPGALLAAVGAVDPQRPASRRPSQAVFQEPRRLRHGGRRRRAGAGKL